ncbi:MAG: SDR family oxidoreductase [Magnetococcales bacterium]|nr:SDR family oxidoreductase [Magnetococcales bacterium]
MEEERQTNKDEPGVGRRMLVGIKWGMGIFVALPFIIILTPMWYIHRWDKKRRGQEVPEPPWAVLFDKDAGKPKPPPRRRVRRPYSEDDYIASKQESIDRANRIAVEELAKQSYGRVAIVTGGGHRIGAAIAIDLAKMGYVVAVAYYQSAKEAEQVVTTIKEMGGKSDAFAMDLRDPESITSLLNNVSATLGPVDLLINNASLFLPTPVKEGRWDVIEDLLQVNLQGPILLAMEAIAIMEERGGHIINMCDIWAEKPLRGHAAYSAAKAGLISATQVLAREAAPIVRVNALAPGAILPPEDKEGRAAFQKILARTPLAGSASPDAILQAIRYLLTAEYVTGEVLHIDGGRRLV